MWLNVRVCYLNDNCFLLPHLSTTRHSLCWNPHVCMFHESHVDSVRWLLQLNLHRFPRSFDKWGAVCFTERKTIQHTLYNTPDLVLTNRRPSPVWLVSRSEVQCKRVCSNQVGWRWMREPASLWVRLGQRWWKAVCALDVMSCWKFRSELVVTPSFFTNSLCWRGSDGKMSQACLTWVCPKQTCCLMCVRIYEKHL